MFVFVCMHMDAPPKNPTLLSEALLSFIKITWTAHTLSLFSSHSVENTLQAIYYMVFSDMTVSVFTTAHTQISLTSYTKSQLLLLVLESLKLVSFLLFVT